MSESNDGRVTLAVLKNEMEHVRRDIAEMREEMKKFGSLLTQTASDTIERITVLETWREGHRDEHEREARHQRIFASVTSSISGVISAIIGSLRN